MFFILEVKMWLFYYLRFQVDRGFSFFFYKKLSLEMSLGIQLILSECFVLKNIFRGQ